ncbi:hypothetical protein MRX96_012769 [Rhipicephalus microplus]
MDREQGDVGDSFDSATPKLPEPKLPEPTPSDDATAVAPRFPTPMPQRRRFFPAAAREESDLVRSTTSWCWEQIERAQPWDVFLNPWKVSFPRSFGEFASRLPSNLDAFRGNYICRAAHHPGVHGHRRVDGGAGRRCSGPGLRRSQTARGRGQRDLLGHRNRHVRRQDPKAGGGCGGRAATLLLRGHVDRGHVVLRSHHGRRLRATPPFTPGLGLPPSWRRSWRSFPRKETCRPCESIKERTAGRT